MKFTLHLYVVLYVKCRYESIWPSCGITNITRFAFCSSCMYTYLIFTKTVEILHKPTQLFLLHLLNIHAYNIQSMAMAASIAHIVDTDFESCQLPCIMGPQNSVLTGHGKNYICDRGANEQQMQCCAYLLWSLMCSIAPSDFTDKTQVQI